MIMIETWHKPDFGDQENVSGHLSCGVKYSAHNKNLFDCTPDTNHFLPCPFIMEFFFNRKHLIL